MKCDVVVVGAGLAGLSAARDLVAGGTDVVVVEARGRAGGRVEQTRLPDGRLVQLGGELVGDFHTAYRGLVDELGLTLVPGFGDEHGPGPARRSPCSPRGAWSAASWPWFSDADRASYDAAEAEFAQARGRRSTPTIPGRTPMPIGSTGSRSAPGCAPVGATPNAVRARELAMLALSAESVERTSLLSDLRKEAAAGASGFYGYAVWESADRRGGLGDRGAADGRGARRPDPLRDAGHRDPDRSRRLRGRDRDRGALRLRRRGQRGAGRAAAPDRDRGGLGRAPRLARPPAPRARRQGLLLLPELVLGARRPQRRRPTWRRR